MPADTQVDRAAEAQLRQACAELERRLRAGESTCAERFLAREPNLFRTGDAGLELVYAEFAIRAELNQNPDPAEWYVRFPQWRARLERLFEVHALATSPLGPRPDAETSATATRASASHQDSYELLEKIGHGGMGVVYKARQVGLNRIVALKMILAGPHADAAELNRFRAEGEAAARLQHANIVQVYEVGELDGQPYFSLEFVEGGSLAKKLAGGPLPARASAQLVETLARAVHYAHQRGIVHRDLKPANVLLQISDSQSRLSKDDVASDTQAVMPKIADFGLAKRLESDTHQTGTGTLIGTPSYMAPEQADGRTGAAQAATDIYGLGAILYESLTGRPPFHGTSALDTLEQVRSVEPVPPSRLQPHVPRDLETICLKCLHKEPRRRYATAEALADDLKRFQAGESIHARASGPFERAVKWARRRPAVTALLAALLAVVLAAFTAVTLLWRHAADALDDTEQARIDLLAQQRLTEAALYDKLLLLARREWEALRFDQAKKYLLECSPERRDSEWHYLHRVLHARVLTYEPKARVADVSFDRSGRWLATAGSRGLVILDATNGREAVAIPCNAFQVVFQGDDRLVAEGVSDKAKNILGIAVWNIRTGVKEGGFALAESWRTNTYLSPRGDAALTRGGRDGQAVLHWHDPLTGKLLHDLGPCGTMYPAVVSGDGARLAALDTNAAVVGGLAVVRVWDLPARKLLSTISLPMKVSTLVALSVSGVGNRLAVVFREGSSSPSQVKIFDTLSGKELLTFPVHAESVNGVLFCPEGRRLATAAQDRSVVLWDVTTGKELLTFREDSKAIFPKAFSPDGRRLAAVGTTKLYVWDTSLP
jgi:hypothetical protein